MAKTLTFQSLGRYGRLGNQMFQIASTIGIARRNGWGFAFPYWQNHDHKERFNTSEDIDVQKYFEHKLPMYNGPVLPDSFIHWGYWPINLNPNGRTDISLSGHLQSEKYFLHCQDEIRYFFTMVDEYPSNNYCAIHVRLGDYDDNYHPRLKMDYYNKAIEQIREANGPDTTFVVFSDDPECAAKMFYESGHSFYVRRDTSYIDDFKFMKSCRHFIIGNSTYSWWPAWLSNQQGKKVIAPANWFRAIANLSSQDIYAKNWEVI